MACQGGNEHWRSRYTAEVAVVASLARNVTGSVWGLFGRRYRGRRHGR